MQDVRTKILLNEPVAEDVYRLRANVPWKKFQPGQFVMVNVPGGEVFLRRPFGIADFADGCAEICYKVVGKGTTALSRAAAGNELSVMGPCGNGFTMPAAKATAVLIAGGYGIAPLHALALRLKKEGADLKVFIGARTAKHLFYHRELVEKGIDVRISTEDGSLGRRGLVTEDVAESLKKIEHAELFVCGPNGLLREAAKIGKGKKIRTQLSLETYMACGIGVCLGCACKDKNGEYVRTCREGPVFEAGEITF